jgi:hypothetical protein
VCVGTALVLHQGTSLESKYREIAYRAWAGSRGRWSESDRPAEERAKLLVELPDVIDDVFDTGPEAISAALIEWLDQEL